MSQNKPITLDSLPPRYVANALHKGPNDAGLLAGQFHNTHGLLGDEIEISGVTKIKADVVRCRYYYWHHKDDLVTLWVLNNQEPADAWVAKMAGDL